MENRYFLLLQSTQRASYTSVVWIGDYTPLDSKQMFSGTLEMGVVFSFDVYQVNCYKTIYLIAFLGYNRFL